MKIVINQRNPLVLASASPRRRLLLSQLRLPFRVRAGRVEEDDLGNGDPSELCCALAQRKALQVHPMSGLSWVLGADTVVAIGERVLGKPRDQVDAREMLSLLSGKEHTVVTGFCLVDPVGRPVHSEGVRTAVRFKPLDDTEIEAYIRTGEPFGKAGAYAIQGIGAFMVASVTGSYTNVVGLPVCEVVKALVRVGAIERFPLEPS